MSCSYEVSQKFVTCVYFEVFISGVGEDPVLLGCDNINAKSNTDTDAVYCPHL